MNLIMQEILDVAFQQLRLVTSLGTYHGVRIPEEKRTQVVLIPGFGGVNATMLTLWEWLYRTGRRPVFPPIRWYVGCPDTSTGIILKLVRKLYERHGPVSLIGHSQGGVKACGIRALAPELLGPSFALGSPLRLVDGELLVSDSVKRAFKALAPIRKLLGEADPACSQLCCTCKFRQAVTAPLPPGASFYSIYSKYDPVVDWRASLKEGAINCEVHGLHASLIWNPQAFRIIDNGLGQSEHVYTATGLVEDVVSAVTQRFRWAA